MLEKEYYGTPLELHRKISYYFDEGYNTPGYNENIKIKILDLLNKIAQTKSDYEEAKGIMENIYNEVDLIKCYTSESIIYRFLNQCLREIDDKFTEFAGLLNYALYKYYYDNPDIQITQDITLYRKAVISIKDFMLMTYLKVKLYVFLHSLQQVWMKMHFNFLK